MPLAEKWLELLKEEEVRENEFEILFENIFTVLAKNCAEVDPIGMGGHQLFDFMSCWTKETGILKSKFQKLGIKLTVLMHYNYFLQLVEFDGSDEKDKTAYRISKKWLELIDSSSVTQKDIDSIMKELLSPDELVGTMWCTMTYDFRDWAELKGFNVLSDQQLRDHYEILWQNMIKK